MCADAATAEEASGHMTIRQAIRTLGWETEWPANWQVLSHAAFFEFAQDGLDDAADFTFVD